MRKAARHPSQRNILPPGAGSFISERPLNSKRPLEYDDVN
jgi:hypothetical protein